MVQGTAYTGVENVCKILQDANRPGTISVPRGRDFARELRSEDGVHFPKEFFVVAIIVPVMACLVMGEYIHQRAHCTQNRVGLMTCLRKRRKWVEVPTNESQLESVDD
jgi:hypothetical protein